ncbi:MAG: hypothetical protein IPO54_04920 [Micavibrio sp.]|jgi:Ca2+-binding EF-hand superfamily protein|nr:hypothetical protein [Micavibrio sp.]
MKKVLLYSLLFVLPGSMAHASLENIEIETAFIVADIFPNGFIDSGEFDIYNLKTFESLDMDGSASLDREECMNDCFPNNINVDGSPGVIRYPFRVLDADKSESITAAEYLSHGRKQFKVYDDDKNSSLNKEEFYAFYQGLKDRTFIAEKSDEKQK